MAPGASVTRGIPPAAGGGPGSAVRPGDLLAQRVDERLHGIPVAPQIALIVAALGDAQAGALGDHVLDLRRAVDVHHQPFHVGGLAVRADDDGVHRGAARARHGAPYREAYAFVLAHLPGDA